MTEADHRQRIVEALARTPTVGQAAKSLGISRVTLWTKMKRLGMKGKSEISERSSSEVTPSVPI